MIIMYTTILALALINVPAQQGGGVAFLKLVNSSNTTIEVHVASTSTKDFAQSVKIEVGQHHFMAVNAGQYTCMAQSNKKECTVAAGQIMEIAWGDAKVEVATAKQSNKTEAAGKLKPPPVQKKQIVPDMPELPTVPDAPIKKEEPKKEEPKKVTPKEEPKKVEVVKMLKVDVSKAPDEKALNKAFIELRGLPADGVIIKFDSVKARNPKQRLFQSPELNEIKDYYYYYTVGVEAVINGQTYKDSKRIIITPGQRTVVTYSLVTVEVPALPTKTESGRAAIGGPAWR